MSPRSGLLSKVNPTFVSTFNALLNPYDYYFPIAGIQIDSVGSITIGDPSASSNLFENEYTGINTYNSNVNIYNNHFYYNTNICNTCTNKANLEACIYARGNSKTTPNTVNIGSTSSSSYKNTFNNSAYGVYARDTLNLQVSNNTFSTDNYGTYVYGMFNTNIKINQNTMSGISKYGVYCAASPS